MSEERDESVSPGMVVMTTETFTVTPQGGWLTSSHDNNISIFLPPKAVSTLIQTQMKVRFMVDLVIHILTITGDR